MPEIIVSAIAAVIMVGGFTAALLVSGWAVGKWG